MRKNSSLMGLLLAPLLLLCMGMTKREVEVIKEGLNALTLHAVNGPQISCEKKLKVPLSPAFSQLGANCSQFIKRDGFLGKLGNVITSHIDGMGKSSLFHSTKLQGMRSSCPKWQKLTKEQRDYFWVWVFASISWRESTCGANTINRAATHGTAVGHLQLNKNRKDRAWRGGKSGKSCAVRDISPPEANIKCGIEILHEQLKGKEGLYQGNGNLFGRKANSYWHHLRLQDGGSIIKLIRDFPHCKMTK